MTFLMFRLYGPLAAWGSIAVGQERPSDAHPSKSALLGLLAAAMGIRRSDTEGQRRLAVAYGFAVRVDASGAFLRDYHTAQVPPERRHVRHRTRRDEVRAEALNTILSNRDYRCDALYTVALWVRDEARRPFTLTALAEGLRQPQFTLYLGRKSCPLALPLQPSLVTSANLETAFREAHFCDDEDLQALERSKSGLLYWEADPAGLDAGALEPVQTITRRDQPVDRQRWQFSPRREHQTWIGHE
ncbi:type I-E CRISPR-associated protein Cas5/CasD [Candidatus Entotheonella palauensis]|uniref:type I-E CRISPR-associated protein Cas5/CasD n=1 Tax=Candidatus Entotheonella palauensis TaxID=93172 RepID=UPI000B7D9E9B|nr:type I-E CRISPR-associated protein Cas5/CasD [Candidatus Entotheonella palauensis]